MKIKATPKEEQAQSVVLESKATDQQKLHSPIRLSHYWIEFVERLIGTIFNFQLHEFTLPEGQVVMAFSIENHRIPSYLSLSQVDGLILNELSLTKDPNINGVDYQRQNYYDLLNMLKRMRNAIRISPSSIKHEELTISSHEYLGGLRLLIQLIRTIALYTNRQEEIALQDPLKTSRLRTSPDVVVDLYNEMDRQKIIMLSKYLTLKSRELAMLNGILPPEGSDGLFICIWLLLRHPLKPLDPPISA